MPRYLNPKSDLVFKRIFGEHPDLLKSFLNAVLPLPSDCLIADLTYLPTESVPEIPEFKYTIVDVRCVDTKGRHFIVEMQLQWSGHFMQRMLFNTASTYVRQLEKGESYERLCPVYGLAVVDDVFSKEDVWFHHYQMINVQNKSLTLDDIQLVFLELPKFKPSSRTEKKLTALWLRFLTEINEKTETVDRDLLQTPDIYKALSYAEISAYTQAELRAYDKSWDAVSAEKTLLSDNYHKGKAEGREEGREEERHNLIKILLSKGLDPEFIAQNTDMPIAIVLAIQKNSI